MKSLIQSGTLALSLLFPALASQAQVLIDAVPFTHNQPFTDLGTSTTAWANNQTLTGWYATAAKMPITSLVAGSGSSSLENLFNFGNSADRALGAVQSKTSGDMAYGLRLKNNTSATFRRLVLSFDGEQWRNGGKSTTLDATAQPLYFMYQISSSPITSLTATPGGAEYYEMNFISPVWSNTAAALDGNQAANRTTITATLEINLPAGSEMMLKWVDPDDNGMDHGLAIDNVNISLTETAPAFESITNAASFANYFNLGVVGKILTSTNSPDWTDPSTAAMDTWATGLTQAADGAHGTAYTTLAGINYKLLRLTKGNATYTVLRPTSESNATNYRGFYYLNLNGTTNNVALQVPHPIHDFRTPQQGSYLFEEMGAYFLAVSGHHRCMSAQTTTCAGVSDACGSTTQGFRTSDPAHNLNNYFQRATQTLAAKLTNLNFVQLHGFEKAARDPHFIISNGTRAAAANDRVTALGTQLVQAPAADGQSMRYVSPQDSLTYNKLIGTTNVQGRALNNYSGNICTGTTVGTAPTGRFLHIEQFNAFRTDTRNYPTLRNVLTAVFATNTPANRTAQVTGATAEKPAEVAISVYPSPNDGHFTVEGAAPGSSLTIVNPLGATVLKTAVTSTAEAVDLSHLPAGVYFVRVLQPGAGLLTKQVVVSR